jgi:hypothetical protein
VRLTCLALILILGLGLTGCANFRDSVMGNIRARSEIDAGAPPSYAELTITWPTDPSARPFSIRLPGGRILALEDLTYDRLKGTGFKDLSTLGKETYFDLGEEKSYDVSHHVEGFGVDFIFVGERLAEIYAYASPASRLKDEAAFGSDSSHGVIAGSATFFGLPMTQEELRVVFGRPDRIEKRTVL